MAFREQLRQAVVEGGPVPETDVRTPQDGKSAVF